MQIKEIKPNVFACLTANETSNAGFIVTSRGVVVIDTLASPAHGRELVTAIRSHTAEPILFVINTHHHHDHVFGNQAFDAPVIAHCTLAGELAERAAQDLTPGAIAERIAENPEDRWLADELELVYPNIIFEKRLVLDLPPLLLVVRHLGGHTPDTTIVDLPDENLLFAGDLVFEGRVPYLVHAHFGNLTEALRELQAVGSRTIVPGHGELCDTTYVGRVRDYVEALYGGVGNLIGQGWEKGAILESDQLPTWWTDDRPDVLRLNIERVYDELAARI